MDKPFQGLGFGPGEILLPKDCDMTKWSVVACDQYTSQPEYWDQVDKLVGDSPSTLRLILPESKLDSPDTPRQIAAIHQTMEAYQTEGRLEELGECLIYVERTLASGKIRRGLVGQVDLKQFDYEPGAKPLIRATEGTVLSRIPPRMAVRENASLELPHVMLLIDDPQGTVIQPLAHQTPTMEPLYDYDLMMKSGHISGWKLTEEQMEEVAKSLSDLADPGCFAEKYDVKDQPVMLFAVGDGNHSLAAAKACYEKQKDNPKARYALVEVVNLHDEALEFEPIHRVLFDVEPDQVLDALMGFYPDTYRGIGEGQQLGYVYAEGEGVLTIPKPSHPLPVGSLQVFLDKYLEKHKEARIDYIHGDDVAREFAQKPNTLSFLLPAMDKNQLFSAILKGGALPRKTFSMGEASDKRFYLEARKIK